jgi:hypothetical protein
LDHRIEIYFSMLALAETAYEGLEHIHLRTMQGHFEDTAELFTDVADSFHELHRALSGFLPDYGESELEKQTAAVTESMKLMLAGYEDDKEIRPMVVLQFSLLPGFRRWFGGLQEALGSFCASSMN